MEKVNYNKEYNEKNKEYIIKRNKMYRQYDKGVKKLITDDLNRNISNIWDRIKNENY